MERCVCASLDISSPPTLRGPPSDRSMSCPPSQFCSLRISIVLWYKITLNAGLSMAYHLSWSPVLHWVYQARASKEKLMRVDKNLIFCRMETKELKAEVNQLGVLMGLYVYIWNRLIKERVPACFCDGTLCTTLDAILSPVAPTADPFHIQGMDAELIAKTAAVHCLLRDDIKEIRKVLEAKAKPRMELARAFKVGQGYEALKDQIHDTSAQRVWQGKAPLAYCV